MCLPVASPRLVGALADQRDQRQATQGYLSKRDFGSKEAHDRGHGGLHQDAVQIHVKKHHVFE
jgi:hypothetical protein